jgi:catalase-peroxidase
VHSRDLENPLAAVQMGLIYVNPEGPDGNPDPRAAAKDIRDTFGRMAMNDEETVALIAAVTRSARRTAACHQPRGRRAGSRRSKPGLRLEQQVRRGAGGDAITSGLEVTWTTTPTKWSNNFLPEPVRLRVGAHQEPGRRASVEPKGSGRDRSRTRRRPSKLLPTMLTRILRCASIRLRENLAALPRASRSSSRDAFARPWFKLTHRDMGPRARYLGPGDSAEELIWQDPIPRVDHRLIDAKDIAL